MLEKIGPVRNPLTIIAIFAGIVEVGATSVLPFVNPELQKPFLWFLMLFPTLLVAVFFLTLNFNSRVLYAPSDFSNENNFMCALEKGLSKSPQIADLQHITATIRGEVDGLPMFQFARLPTIGQCFVKRLYHAKKLSLDEYAKNSDEKTKLELKRTADILAGDLGWARTSGNIVELTDKGATDLASFIELTIARAY